MGKDRPILDASLSDRRRAFKFFVVNFRDFCVMRDYINPAFDHQDYWIAAKRPKAMAALLLSTRKSPRRTNKILHNGSSSSLSWRGADHAKYTPFPRHPETRARNVYPSMAYSSACGIQKMQLSFSSWWQRDIFVIGLNDSYRCFRSDIIPREDLTSLTFAQVISKARDFEASIQTDSAITQ